MRGRSCLRLVCAAVTASLLSFEAGAAARPAGPAAMAVIAGLSGKVEVARKGARAEQASLGLALRRGDRLLVAPGASASLLFNDGNTLELPEKSAFTLGAAGRKPDHPPDELMAGVFKSVADGVVGGTRENGLVAMAPARGGPRERTLILAPRQTDLLDDRPAFRWRGMSGAERYVVTLSGDAGELWHRETADTALAYPAEATALERGQDYVWQVEVRGEAGVVRHESSGFRVKSQADADRTRRHVERIERDGPATDGSRAYLAGAYLASQGLLLDAAERFQSLCAAHPGEPGPHEALARVYRSVGLADDAATELERALQLTRKP